MAKIIPITDLKKTSELSSMCHETDGPVYISKNGYDDMVIMSTEEYELIQEKMRLYNELLLSQDDINNGRTKDAFEALDELRGKYGI